MKKLLWILAAVFYVGAGILHFRAPAAYLKILPPYVPWPETMVYLSGIAEIAGGLGLLLPATRRWAAWGLVALLIAVFPANIYMATNMAANPIRVGASPMPEWIAWARLPLQPVLIWWVLWCTRETVK